MRGLIGKKDVLLHPLTVIGGFGLKVFFKTIFSSEGKTFLEIISEDIPEPHSAEQIKITLLFDKMISLQLRTGHIYARMAELFRGRLSAREFFYTLSYQEEGDAEILRITKVEVARRSLWSSVKPALPEDIEKVDKEITRCETELREPEGLTLKRGLELVEQIESVEIKMAFDFLLHSVQTPFLKRVHHLIPSMAEHHAYINSTLPELKQEAAREEYLRRPKE